MSGPSLKDVVDLVRTYLSEPIQIRDDGRPSWADELGMALCAMVAEVDEIRDSAFNRELFEACRERAAGVWELCTTPDPVCADPDCLEYGEHEDKGVRWCWQHRPEAVEA